MRIGYPTCVLFIVHLSLCSSISYPTSGDISKVLRGLEKIVQFFSLSVGETNLDGLFGLKVIEGVLKEVTAHTFLFNQLEEDLKLRLQKLLSHCEKPLLDGIGAVQRNDPTQFQNLKSLVTDVYTTHNVPRIVKPELKWSSTLNMKESFNAFNEDISDKCIGAVVASRGQETCSISQSCVKSVTTQNLQSYPLTHQLLFTMEVEKSPKCTEMWENMLKDSGYYSNSEFQRIWCTNSYYEVLRLVKVSRNSSGAPYHWVGADQLDLFYEHLFVCPSIGFYEFLKEEYLDIIYRAQEPSGCYKNPMLKSPVGRKPLMEVEAKDGCMFHMTAVAGGALTAYLRYMLQLKYTPDQLHMYLQNDYKHYLRIADEMKVVKPSTKQLKPTNATFYAVIILLNVIFALVFAYKRPAFLCRRFNRRIQLF